MARARRTLHLVYADSEASEAELLIEWEKANGARQMDEALKVIAAKQGSNPRRSLAYLWGILRNR